MTGTPTDEQVGKAYDEWDDPAPWSGPCYCAGFLAGHEAATRTRVVTTVTELDALPEEAVIRDSNRMVFERWRRWEAVGGAPVDPVLPARVLYVPEEGR